MNTITKRNKMINRNPTDKQKTEALELSCLKKHYNWHGFHRSDEWADSLWDALRQDSDRRNGGIFDRYRDKEADYLMHDTDFQNEHRRPDLWKISVKIGNKGRIIYMGDVVAKTEKEAKNTKNEIIQEIGSEFSGMKYEIIAEPFPVNEQMSDEEFERICYEHADMNIEDIEEMIDVNKDDEVADYFDIEYNIDCYLLGDDEVSEKDVIAICSCGEPLLKSDFDFNPHNCGEDLRSADEKFTEWLNSEKEYEIYRYISGREEAGFVDNENRFALPGILTIEEMTELFELYNSPLDIESVHKLTVLREEYNKRIIDAI